VVVVEQQEAMVVLVVQELLSLALQQLCSPIHTAVLT
jgi:hypothetical protein